MCLSHSYFKIIQLYDLVKQLILKRIDLFNEMLEIDVEFHFQNRFLAKIFAIKIFLIVAWEFSVVVQKGQCITLYFRPWKVSQILIYICTSSFNAVPNVCGDAASDNSCEQFSLISLIARCNIVKVIHATSIAIATCI